MMPTSFTGLSGPTKPLQYFDTALPYAYTFFGLFADKAQFYALIGSSYAYSSEIGRFGFVRVLTGLVEVARWVLLGFWLRAVAQASRAFDEEGTGMLLAMGVPIMVGIMFVLNLIVVLMPTPTTEGGMNSLFNGIAALQLVGLIGAMAVTVIAGVATYSLRRLVRPTTKSEVRAKRR
jgi:hypothetical protein